jgi:spermidine synthase
MAPPRWFLLVYAVSGAAALVYEVAWTRLLTLYLGHGVAAASTVLAAFMGGLAIGAAWGGPLADRTPRPAALRLYAILELAIAALAILVPFVVAVATPLLAWAYADGAGGATFAILRLVVCLALVAVPAVAMGATFPIVARWYVADAVTATRGAGALYAANTVGAALGALAAGFLLLPNLGLRATTGVGVALNLAVAAAAWGLARRPVPAAAATPSPTPTPSPAARRAGRKPLPSAAGGGLGHVWLAALALGVSGFASLVLQVVWSRLLAQIIGPTTYAFSLVVAIFIGGLAVGAVAGRWLAARAAQPAAWLAGAIGLAVLATTAAAWTVDEGLLAMARAVAAPDATFASVLRRQMLLAAAWLVPLALGFGAAFPFAVRLGTGRDASLSADLGLIYAVNTIGAIAGSLAAGFVLVPRLGLYDTVRAVGVTAAAAALLLAWRAGLRGRARLAATAACVAAMAAAALLPPWSAAMLSSGAYKYASAMSGEALDISLTAGRLLYYRDGATASVAVRDAAGTTSLSIDGKVDASNTGDMLTQRLLAHVPMLLHPAPRRAAILGLGSGVTTGAALRHPVERVDVLEISPEVVQASRFFEPENARALADPRTRLIVGDGRTHLLLGRESYDVIVSEPSNPWMAGIASLFTREFFATAKARLAPGGVLCQWAHTYDISPEDLRSIVGTFAEVFPDGTLWLVGDGDILLIGGADPMLPRVSALADVWASRAEAAGDLARVGARDPFAVVSLLVATGATLSRYAGGAPPLTDDYARVEFSGPRTVFSRARVDNAAALRALAAEQPVAVVDAARAAASSASWRDRGRMLLDASAPRAAWSDFETALRRDPGDVTAYDGLLEAGAAAARTAETIALLREVAAPPDRVEAQVALSHFLASTGAVDEAVAVALAAAERNPSHVRALEQLASILSDVRDRDRLMPVVARLRSIAPTADATRYYSASLFFLDGRTDQAIAEARSLVAANPTHARAYNLLGAALATQGRREAARDAFLASLKVEPRDPSTYTNLGLLELETGNRDAGLQRLAEALLLDPTAAAAREAYVRESARGDGT